MGVWIVALAVVLVALAVAVGWLYNSLMQRIRDSLDAGEFDSFRNKFTEILDKRI